ncbi:lysine histidine transporter-like 7 [Euphorbia lathyris]|uniref:lysine histidine transporter-like 7 n=1 Tax=Euphorbia lathyris TaxID=212925 RepID=UPI0033131C13
MAGSIQELSLHDCLSPSPQSLVSIEIHEQPQPQPPNPFTDDWLPLTESRNGNFFSCVFHLLSSSLGFQALLLPLVFSLLGWLWGIICVSMVFGWQLYTTWLLVHLHEAVPGIRISRYLHLAIVAFGPKVGKIVAIFPVMYLSGGSCVITIITGGRIMELLFGLVSDKPNSLSGTGWFFIFTCVAITLAHQPSLNSITAFSFVASITSIAYFTLIWVSTIPPNAKPSKVSHAPLQHDMPTTALIFNALAILMLSFRGHNLVLEIQGTLPSDSSKIMWKAVVLAYLLIDMCMYPLAILEFWAYGNQIPRKVGTTSVFLQFYLQNAKKVIRFIAYMLVLVNCFSSFQIYAMPVFDNLEMKYTSIKNKRCSCLVRTCIRIFFGGLTFFISVAFPFLPNLPGFIGGLALPLTYVYPCLMWISIQKTPRNSSMWCLNLLLACLGVAVTICSVTAALWTLVTKGLSAHFFKP